MSNKALYYIDKEEFYNAMVEYKKSVDESKLNGTPKPQIPNYLCESVIKLVTNMAQRSNFATYTYKDEMILDAIENIILKFDNFDPTNNKQNPFGYFSMISWRAFIRRLQKESVQHYIKCKTSANFGNLDEDEYGDLDEDVINEIQLYDNLYEFMDQFEQKVKTKKKKAIEKIKGVESLLT